MSRCRILEATLVLTAARKLRDLLVMDRHLLYSCPPVMLVDQTVDLSSMPLPMGGPHHCTTPHPHIPRLIEGFKVGERVNPPAVEYTLIFQQVKETIPLEEDLEVIYKIPHRLLGDPEEWWKQLGPQSMGLKIVPYLI